MKSSSFSLEFFNFSQFSIIFCKSETCIYPKVLEEESFFHGIRVKPKLSILRKDLKKASSNLITMQLTEKKPDYFCDVKHLQITKIMADNILQEHIRFLRTQHNLYNHTIYVWM